jgi:hypothetical protein
MFNNFEYCNHRIELPKTKIRIGDGGYPSMAWGFCLPDDDDNVICQKTKDCCFEDQELFLDFCPRFEQISESCPYCLEDEQKEFNLYKDIYTGIKVCPNCREIIKEKK